MARQPLIPVALLALSTACPERPPYAGAFQLPVAAAVLQPEVGTPFDEPIGFVANGHGGQIVQLALKQGRFLVDDPTVSFLRTNYLATGATRRLSSVAVRALGQTGVEVWAGDQRYGVLLHVPYILECTAPADGCDDAPPVEQDVDYTLVQEPGTATLSEIVLKRGYTTTEQFIISYDGAAWTVEGTRSGRQPNAQSGVAYSTLERELGFTILDPNGAAQAGDTFLVDTTSGITEIDVGGTPLDLKSTRDGSLLALLVLDRTTSRPVIRWFDPLARQIASEVVLAPDAWPTRLAWAEDGALLATDRDRPAVWEIPVGQVAAIEHPTPWPTLDVASLDGEDRRRLYLVPLDGSGFWMMDRDTNELLDVNPATAGAQGLFFTATVLGIEGQPRRYPTTEFTQDTLRVIDRTVTLVLSDGTIAFAHEATGCLQQDNLGPRTAASGGTDYTTTFDASTGTAATLERSEANSGSVIVNNCAGIALAETWEVKFDQNLQAWRVKGGLSGDQANLAYSDLRYLSDEAAISFTIRSGALPPVDGDTFTFTVDQGIPTVFGDANGDGAPDLPLGIGTDPVYFEYRVGLAGAIGDLGGEGWYAEDIRPFTLIAGSASNTVARVDPSQGQLEVGWN